MSHTRQNPRKREEDRGKGGGKKGREREISKGRGTKDVRQIWRDRGRKRELWLQRVEEGGGGMAMHDARREITGFADLLSSHSNYQPLHPASKPL